MRSYVPTINARGPRFRSPWPSGILSATLLSLALAPACSSGENPTVSASGMGEGRTLQADNPLETAMQATAPTDAVSTGAVGNSAAASSDSTSTFAELGDSTEGEGVNADTACAGLEAMAEENVMEVPREVVTEIVTEVDKPVALYIVLDNSGSMDDDATSMPAGGMPAGGMATGGAAPVGAAGGAALLAVPAGGAGGATATGGAATGGAAPVAAPRTKWEAAVQAITDFVNDPGSAGIEVAIQYTSPGATEPRGRNQGAAGVDECDGSAQGQPAVAMGLLPDNSQAIVDSLQAAGPYSNTTATVGALIGGVDFCVNYELENPDKTCVAVMVTDGAPNGCGLDDGCAGGGRACIDPMAEGILTPIAAQGLVDGVTTFTVGMAGITEEGFALLDAIALAGGSDCTPGAAGDEACDVSTSGAAGFLEALNTIRETVSVTETMTEIVTDIVVESVVLPCEFTVPPPTTGEPIDEDLVIVNLSIDGAEPEKLTKVADQASCAGDGWYFPDLSDLTQISACQATCDRITAASSAKIDLLLGCEDKLQ